MPRFIADSMLGTLAKWLRLLGYDTVYPPVSRDDDELVRMAHTEGRILLTRDRGIALRKSSRDVCIVVIKSDKLMDQIRETFSALNIDKPYDPKNFLTRCSVCNTELRRTDREEAAKSVPCVVLERHERFWKCDSCGRFYWEGTHWKRMSEFVCKIQC